ncbi:retrovirus-related pol polyprotein from transposon TNT 1-94, partial [Tanacetum coccineum]
MANLSEDIQCAGSDTRPPMLDRTDFASWQQRIRLYCRGKENGVNILKSIDEGPFQMGTFRETLAEGTEGALHLGPERPRVYFDLSPEDKERYNADIRATNILLQGLPKDIYTLINHYTDAKDIWDNVKMLLEVQDGRVVVQNVQGRQNRGHVNNAQGTGATGYRGAQNRVGNANPGQARQENGVALDEEQLLFIAGGQDNAIDEDVDEQPVQDLALNVDNVFQADDYDAFDSDVDEAPTAQTMFMANLSSADPVYDEAGPSYDSDILSEVHDHDHYQDAVCEHHEEHEMHDDVQPNYIVDSHANYMSDSNMIPYEQYVKDNVVPVVQSNVSSVQNDAYMMIFNDMHESHAQSVSDATRNTIVDNSLIVELATYKEQVKLYERQARKHDEIERKNLLIANDNLIVDCLSKEVFYIATNSELTVSRYTEMHEAHTIFQTRCLELEAELSKLRDKVQKDDHTELVKHFSNLEVNHLNLQLKYQNLKESFGNNPSLPARDTPDFDSVLVNRKKSDRTLDFRTLDFQITQLTKKVTVLQEQNELFRAENEKVKQHYKELYDSIKIMRAKHIEQTTALLTENENLKAQIHENLKCNTIESVKPRVLAPGRYAIDVEPIPPHNRNNREVHIHYLKHLKESVETLLEIVEKAKASPSVHNIYNVVRKVKQVWKPKQVRQVWKPTGKVLTNVGHQWRPTGRIFTLGEQCPLTRLTKSKVVSAKQNVAQIVLWYLDSGCSKHMTGDRSRLRNFMKKFIGIVRFRNDHFGAIMGYRDYVIGESVISRVYYVEGLGHNLFFVGQFCDSDLDVAFRKHSCYVQDTDDVKLIKGSHGSNLYTISVKDMMKSSPICLLSKASKNKSWLWHRRLNHLNFGTINDLARKDLVRGLPRLKFEKDHLCSAC